MLHYYLLAIAAIKVVTCVFFICVHSQIKPPFLRLFHRSPPARVLFGFPIDIDPDSDDLRFSKRFVTQAMYMIQMLDSSISMLGPDIDMLSEIMVINMLAKLFMRKYLFRSHLASF
jgi:hypothetical protein